MSKRRGDRWQEAGFAWGLLDDSSARVVVWMEDGIPRIVARGRGAEVTLLASPTWETVAELLMRASYELRKGGWK